MKQYEQAKKLIAENDDADFVGPRPEAFVAKAEKALGLKFPPTYRRFLLELGSGGVDGFEVYGIVDDNFEDSSVPDGIWLTLDLRKNGELPPEFVIIGEDGDGGYYALHTGELDAAGEAPVIALLEDGSGEQVADSFGQYLLEAVQESVEDEDEDEDEEEE